MNTNFFQSLVFEFMKKFGQKTPFRPTPLGKDLAIFRINLIQEELDELFEAFGLEWDMDIVRQTRPFDMIASIDALCDLLYVVFGTIVSIGIQDIEPFFMSVHVSNMNKEGGSTRPDGKILKPEGWKPPNLEQVFSDHYD